MICYCDGDLVAYRAGFAAQKTRYFLQLEDDTVRKFPNHAEMVMYATENKIDTSPEGAVTKHIEYKDEDEAIGIAHGFLDRIRNATKCDDHIVVFLTGETNFRDEVAVTKKYKGNRDNQPKPRHLGAIRKWLIEEWGAVVSDNEEADDLLGIVQCESIDLSEECCIASYDKDLDMIAGKHYDFVKETKYRINPEEADLNFLKQLISGDSTDNIPGLKGFGKVKAAEVLDGMSPALAYTTVTYLYKEKVLDNWEEYMIEQGQLLWIRRAPNDYWRDYFE